MKTIPLTQDKVALVDDDDYGWLSLFDWAFNPAGSGYAQRRQGRKMYMMHRDILNAKLFDKVDHINGDGLDNQKANLRLCTHQQNNQNTSKRSHSQWEYKGIRKQGNKWTARITDGMTYHIGSFDTARDAAIAYDREARKRFGEFAKLNFPELEHIAVELKKSTGYANKSSQYRGVYFDSHYRQWKLSYLGKGRSFDNEEDAAKAYDALALQAYGDEADVNFPTLA